MGYCNVSPGAVLGVGAITSMENPLMELLPLVSPTDFVSKLLKFGKLEEGRVELLPSALTPLTGTGGALPFLSILAFLQMKEMTMSSHQFQFLIVCVCVTLRKKLQHTYLTIFCFKEADFDFIVPFSWKRGAKLDINMVSPYVKFVKD